MPSIDHRKQAAQRIGGDLAGLVNAADDRRAVLGDAAFLLQGLDLFRRIGARRVDSRGAQGPLDGHLPIAELGVVEDARLLRLLEGEERLDDALDIGVREFAVLLAKVLAQRLEPRRRVDQLHAAAAVARLAVGQHPDIGGDAGVVEHVQRQRDDGFQPVVLDNPAPDIALALPASPVNSDEPL